MVAPEAGRRSAIVTGGASGIGRALVRELATRGVGVVVADRQIELAEEVAADVRAVGVQARALELDVRDAERFREVVRLTVAETGRLDYLFNNAGIVVAGEIHTSSPEDWDDVIDVNLRGVAHGILAAYPQMIAQGSGHIVNTASLAGLVPAVAQGSYTATKHAVVGLSRALRVEARRHGVRVSVLCPGLTRTPILGGGRYGRWKLGVDRSVLLERAEALKPMDPALLAQRTLRAVERNRGIIVEPRRWRLLWYLDRLSPSLLDRLSELAYRRLRASLASPS